VTTTTRVLLLSLSAGVCFAIVVTSGMAYNHYAILYGLHGWSPSEIAFLLHYLLFGSLAVVLLVLALNIGLGQRLNAGFDRLASLTPRFAWLHAIGASVAVFGLVAAARHFLFGDTAITDDENVYAFMARTFASGHVYLPSLPDPVRPFFDNQFVVNNGKWYGIYFPGHPIVLALGEHLHLMHWVPACSAALTVLVGFAIGRRAFGQRVALLALPLLLLSPFFILSSATLLAHSTAGLLLAVFVYATLRVLEHPECLRWWLAASLALGWTGLTRPLSAAAFGLPWTVLLALRLRHGAGQVRVGAALFCLVGAASMGVLALYNMALSGDPLTTGYHTFGSITGLSFTLGALVAPAPFPSLFELGYTVARLNFWLFGWPISLVLLPFVRRTREGLALLLGPVAVISLFAVTTVPSINVVGPVHYAELILPLALVSASGLEQLALWVRGRLHTSAGWALAVPMTSTVCALLLYLPLYISSLSAMAAVARAPYDLVATARLDHAVVFVRSLGALEFPPWSWAYSRRNPSPGLGDRVLYVRDLGEERDRDLIRFMPDRTPFWMGVRDGKLVLIQLPR